MIKHEYFDGWIIALILFIISTIVSAFLLYVKHRPTFQVITAGSGNEGAFDDATLLKSQELIGWLELHFKRMVPVLKIWQKRAWTHEWIHYYVVGWTSLISLSLPFLIPYSQSGSAKLFIQIISAFAAIIYGLHSIFRIQTMYQKYRLYESHVYSLIRRIKDDPESFGASDLEIWKNYIKEIEDIRTKARNDEIDNIPSPSTLIKENKIVE